MLSISIHTMRYGKQPSGEGCSGCTGGGGVGWLEGFVAVVQCQ